VVAWPSRDVELVVDGERRGATVAPGATLLDVLRGPLGVTTAKEACGRGECGACTVLVGDRPVMACVTLAVLVDGPVTTAAGLAEPARDLRAELADRGGFQCGYCTPGQVVLGHWVAERVDPAPGPVDPAIAHLMSGAICRCTGGGPIAEAVTRVSLERA
jgi:aerobic-type carbon monoxide dehydrogenase small subunit (CoxS/CutS family)